MNKSAQAIRRRDQQQSMEAVGWFAGILGNAWLIAAVFLLVAALGSIHGLMATPLYEASTVIQIKRNGGGATELRAEDNVKTEMEILRSRSILARVTERLQLDVTLDLAPPTIRSLVQGLLDRAHRTGDPAPPQTQVHVTRLDMPPALYSLPLTLTMNAGHRFTVTSEELGIGVLGSVGTPVRIDSRYGTIDLLIDKGAAEPGTQFILRRISAVQATEQLQRALVVTENAKQSNVIKLTLQGSNRHLMSQILGDIVAEYSRQRHAEQHSEAAELAASYQRQLAASKAAVQEVENQYARLLQRSGIGDPEAEGQLLLQQSSALEMQLAAARQRVADLSARMGDGHPVMEALNRQIADMVRVLNRNAARYESLSMAARQLAQVRRDRQALNETTLALFNQHSKLGAVVSAERDDVRVLEQPEAGLRAVTLGKPTMLILSCFGGIAAGLFASFIKNFMVERKRVLLSTRHKTRLRLISLGRTS